MLRRIQIRDLAIIENLELPLASGMTVITGETGAGKSIMIDALDIALGERADSKLVRHGAERCEVTLEFDITTISIAQAWLSEHDLLTANDCLIRRIISNDGRSRNYINGSLVTLQQLRELGAHLVHIHGQHQHQALVKRDEQRLLLDLYAHHASLLHAVQEQYVAWRTVKKTIEEIESLQQQAAEITLLRYQVEELAQAELIDNEIDQLHLEHKQLANAELLLSQSQAVLAHLADDSEANISILTHQTLTLLNQMRELSPRLDNAYQLLNNTLIEITEAENEIRDFVDQVEMNPERLQQVEQRLNQLYHLARKHKIAPEQLNLHFNQLKSHLDKLENGQSQLHDLRQKEKIIMNSYQEVAATLHHSRQQAANQLNQLVTENMRQLGMPGGQFAIDITYQIDAAPTAHGLDKIEFLVSANPGQPLQSLAKVASGGELSRIGLAIQVITAQAVATPTLVFDEVDVGIGGGTAEIVGKLLRKLGEHAQVLCITHLPQVAAQGHHHLRIHKETENDRTHSHVTFLNHEARIEEVARMLGGVKITAHSLAHAQEMLSDAIG
ncbi:MAG: DNA repair protein RecN [Gammaproteobacteria bacterium]